MVCIDLIPIYAPQKMGGLNFAGSRGDGNQIALEWDRAYPSTLGNSIAYNIYFSTERDDILSDGVKYVSIDSFLNVCIPDLPPGQTYYFIVKAVEYDPSWYNLSLLQDGPDGLKIYNESILLSNITDEDTSIPVSDIADWPSFGVAQVGTELIQYSGKDVPTNSLIVSERGFLESNIRFHNTDGYDGYAFQDPIVRFFKGFEDPNERVQFETSIFAFGNAAFTFADGYAIAEDKVNTDLSGTEDQLSDFPRYDQSGWRRTSPLKLVQGRCIGSYIGGEHYCADGYLGVGRQLRGIPLSEQALAREELLLESTGQPYVLLRRLWEGIRCPCVKMTNEQPEPRCLKCFGTGFHTGYEQFHNERRPDGRLLMRSGPYPDDLKFYNAGLESEAILELWTLPIPAMKMKDVIIRYNPDGTEEFRYEIIGVTRNVLFDQVLGVQKVRAQRIRVTDPVYSWKAIASTADIPTTVTTSIGLLAGPGGGSIPHTHQIVINEGITTLAQVNQTTSVTEGHNHEIRDGIVQPAFGHTHSIII